MTRITRQQANLGGPVRRRGDYYVSRGPNGLIVKKWPRYRGKGRTPAQVYKEAEFGLAARWASSPDGQFLDQAIAAARGVNNVPRDFLTASAFGTHTRFFFEDGTEWTRYRDVTINAQLVLDQVTDEPGEMMYRSPDGWVGVLAGSAGQYLTIVNGVPTFATVGAPGAAIPMFRPPDGVTPGAGSNVAVNSLTGSFHVFKAATIVTGIAVFANAAAATCRLTPGLWVTDIGVSNTMVASGPQVIGVVKGVNLLPFTVPFLTTINTSYCAGVNCNTAVFSQVNQSPALGKWTATNALPLPTLLAVTAIAADNVKCSCWLY